MFCDLFLSEMQGKLIDFGSWGVELTFTFSKSRIETVAKGVKLLALNM